MQTQRLSVEEAFLIATKRVGKPSDVVGEFAKLNRNAVWLDRMLWMLIGIQVWALVHGVMGCLASNAVSFGLVGYDFSVHGRGFPITLFGVANLLGFFASLAGYWWLFSRRGSNLGGRVTKFMRRRPIWYNVAATSLGILLTSFWMNYGMTILRLKLTDQQTFGNIFLSQQYPWVAGSVNQTLVFVILTVQLLRKHQNARRA